jgi:YebC/PmpR family DNA-binding regulatory protein
MAGHSKWAQIKRQKAVKDAQKGQVFARLSREIMVATKLGGPDPEGNFRLRTAIEKAKAALLPNENIRRAIEKGAGKGASDQLEALSYEGYGPGGVAIFIEAMTDNRNRTAGDIRSYFNKYQGNLGADGCVAWIFEAKGLVRVQKLAAPEALVLEHALEAGALDFDAASDEEDYLLETTPEELNTVCQTLTAAGIPVGSAEVTRLPQNTVAFSVGTQAATLLEKLLDAIEAQEDVQAVYHNAASLDTDD